MIKFFLGVSLVVVTTFIGLSLSEKQKIKKNIFENLISFNSDFMCDIGLYRASVISKIEKVDGELGKVFEGATVALERGENFVCKDLRLSEQERDVISAYINNLGAGDEKSQSESLKLYEQKFSSLFSAQEKRWQKCEKLYARLGFSFGLIVVILLI